LTRQKGEQTAQACAIAWLQQLQEPSWVLGYILNIVTSAKRLPQVYWLPLLHVALCITAMLGFVVPQLQFLGILMTVVNIADLPISFVAFALFFHHETLAWLWMVVVGTVWWYLLSLATQFLHSRFGTTKQT
jgi:hypothetical protein